MDHYEITVKGHIEDYWSELLCGMKITRLPNGETMISGSVEDQAQLYGILGQIGDMGLQLIRLDRAKE